MFKRILIANRGEIAARILRTCTRLKIEPVLVYSEPDRFLPYLADAPYKVCIGPKAAYLSEDDILEAALQYEVEAVHPGFGFLAENARFARRVMDLNIQFVGPKPHLITLMGDKANARRTMAKLKIPIMPGSKETVMDEEHLGNIVNDVGLPVLLKASAGGGGKGMRLVRTKDELLPSFREAQKEAKAAFNDDAMYVEKFLDRARHIEFQILGDSFGNVVCLGDRECSIQRNHQKLLEEAPAKSLSDQWRHAIVPKITHALSTLGYENAGTLEFLLDQNDQLYFMEMNTRIQVEHPVTELTTGIDIVEWQLRVAAKERLTLKQEDLKPQGAAIECRINAEEPLEGFRPSPGEIRRLTWPLSSNEGPIRIDTHIVENYKIPPFYDSMVAKIIAYAPTRSEAIERLKKALSDVRIEGIGTTVGLHRAILSHPLFVSGNYDCSFIKDEWSTVEKLIKG